jgi:hypothetical protein
MHSKLTVVIKHPPSGQTTLFITKPIFFFCKQAKARAEMKPLRSQLASWFLFVFVHHVTDNENESSLQGRTGSHPRR